VVGNLGCRRVELYQAALCRSGLAPAPVVAWSDVIAGRVALRDVVSPGSLVRIESPGKDFEVERALLGVGASVAEDDGEFARADRCAVERLEFDRGRILWPRQWYLGFRAVLGAIREQLASCPPHRLMHDPADIVEMFDKVRCHARLTAAAVPQPRSLGVVRSFEHLHECMSAARCRRVFVKLAHGSSASGAVAYQTDGLRHLAATTVEMVRGGGELLLYNSRRVRTYTDLRQIAELIDELARHRACAERWLPKAGLAGRAFDVRVLVIAGRARHAVVRLSRTPFTNLHLLNARGEVAAAIARMGLENWEAGLRSCERAAACFPASLHAGIDLAFAAGFRRHAVLEANAFGDLLPGVEDNSEDTYEAELAATHAEVFRARECELTGCTTERDE
jgi:hypothetical protein